MRAISVRVSDATDVTWGLRSSMRTATGLSIIRTEILSCIPATIAGRISPSSFGKERIEKTVAAENCGCLHIELFARMWYTTRRTKRRDLIYMKQADWEMLSYEEKNRRLFHQQVELLKTFLEHHAISQEQYNKSYNDLVVKMGMKD